MKDLESMLKMPLNSKELLYSIGKNEVFVIKVPGGWMYTHTNKENYSSSIFVPEVNLELNVEKTILND